MDGIIPFMIGSVWTIAVGFLAIWAWIWVKQRLEQGYKQPSPTEKSLPSELGKQNKPVQSGAIKVITPEEIKEEQNKGFIRKVKDIIEP